MIDPRIHPCFLGPYAENDELLEKLVVEFLRDHVYWRRNFHPEDPPAIPTGASQQPEFRAFEAKLRRELHGLSAALKRSVPFHSPRYLGHMVSDLLLPGVIAQFLTLPYNPNNVSADAAPVTIDLELKVGLQLARMLGFNDDPRLPDCAFGHLTSGGTVANFQALRLALALKAFPVALRALELSDLDYDEDDWGAFNQTPQSAIARLMRWQSWLRMQTPVERRRWRKRLQAERVEALGLVEFFARHRQLKVPRVLAPITAHYSWSKGMKLLGLGRAQLELVRESGMRMDLEALEETLACCHAQQDPVLLTVGVLGSTEFGTVDPIHELVAARDRWADRGLGFGVHVDAAWGGYLATLFRNPDGGLRGLSEMRADFEHFPSEQVHAAFGALSQVDSVTVDPHKLGYIPYGAGAFICRDQRATTLLAEEADYVFGPEVDDDYFKRYRQLGRYIPEGSKSGAAAAAVYVTHRVLPLDNEHFGMLPAASIRATEAFRRASRCFASRMQDRVLCRAPFEPDSNLFCLALNPVGNAQVAVMNRFVRALFDGLRADPLQPLQSREFFGSMTTLQPSILGPEGTAEALVALQLDPSSLNDDGDDSDRLVILRHTLMNPFLMNSATIDDEQGPTYIDLYFEFLERKCTALLRHFETLMAGLS